VEEKPAPTPTGRTSANKRGTHDAYEELYCEHCGRQVSRLLFVNACTYECALALAVPSRARYDYVYAFIHRLLDNCDWPMPGIAPPLPNDMMTPEQYWSYAADYLYSGVPGMVDFLRDRMQDNSVDGAPLDIKKQRV
jgi:hypothetical protein